MEKSKHIEEIKALIQPKLSKTENYLKLSAFGYELADIESVLDAHYKPINEALEEQKEAEKPSENRMLFIGMLFLVVAAIRMYRYSSDGNYFMLFGVVTALGIAVIYLIDKR